MRTWISTVVTVAGLTLAAAAPALAADSPATAMPATAGDTLVVLTSDTMFGPDMEDARIAARSYCADRGKLQRFVVKERLPEFRDEVFQSWSALTFKCVSAAEAKP